MKNSCELWRAGKTEHHRRIPQGSADGGRDALRRLLRCCLLKAFEFLGQCRTAFQRCRSTRVFSDPDGSFFQSEHRRVSWQFRFTKCFTNVPIFKIEGDACRILEFRLGVMFNARQSGYFRSVPALQLPCDDTQHLINNTKPACMVSSCA